MLSSYQGSFKSKRLKKTMKDKCMVLGETTMYYGNFGSVHVMSPIPGSPTPGSINIRPDSAKEAVLALQSEEQVTPKKGKKPTSQRKKRISGDKKTSSPKYALPPLKAAPASVNNNRCPPRLSRGREPCQFRPSSDIECRENEYFLGPADTWIPQPGFKPRGKKTMPKNTLTSVSSNLKYEPLGKIVESIKKVQASSSPVTTIRLPAIRRATLKSEHSQTLPPTVQYINIYKDDGHLPPLKVSAMSIANRRVQREHYKNTKSYQW